MNTQPIVTFQSIASKLGSRFSKWVSPGTAPALGLALVATVACCTHGRAAEPAAAAAKAKVETKAEAVIPKSVFVNEPEVGKDPFFPSSTRRKDAIPRVVAVTTNAVPVRSTPMDLKLKGIAGTKEQRLALINSVTVAEGEIAEIKCFGGQVAKILCREIRDDSVIIEFVPLREVRELKLREGI